MKSFKDFISEAKLIKKGDKVRIKKEWQDAGDEKFNWVAVDDEEKGRVMIMATNTGLTIPGTQVVLRSMLEAEVSGDATNIASGETSGNVVGGTGKKKKKELADAGITPAAAGLPSELPK